MDRNTGAEMVKVERRGRLWCGRYLPPSGPEVVEGCGRYLPPSSPEVVAGCGRYLPPSGPDVAGL